MTRNAGTADRVIRALIGFVLLSLVFVLEGGPRWWGLVGLLPLATAVLGYCPAYAMLGINTCTTGKKGAALR